MTEVKHTDLQVVGRARRVRCKMCLESRVVEVDTWDDRVEVKFDHDCKGKGPRLSHPVTRDGQAVPFFPFGNRVLVERLPEDEMVGSLFIPEVGKETQKYATLVAAGLRAQEKLDDMGVRIGETVCFGKYTGVGYDWRVMVDERLETRHVDQLMVDDLYGGKELAEKMVDGRMGIGLHEYEPGKKEYRFFEYVGPEKKEEEK